MVAPNHLYKSGHSEKAVPQIIYKLFFVHLSKALAAINCSAFLGLKRNLSLTAAGSTGSCIHNSFSSAGILSCVTASLASLGLIYKSLFSIKFLFACCESEFVTALLAD